MARRNRRKLEHYPKAIIMAFFLVVFPALLLGKGLSLKEVESLKKLGYSDQEIIQVLAKKKVAFTLTPALRKELAEKGYSSSLLEALEKYSDFSLEKLAFLLKRGWKEERILQKIRFSGFQVPEEELKKSSLYSEIPFSIRYALTHPKGALTFSDLKSLVLHKASDKAILFLAGEVTPPLRLSALEASELLEAGASLELLKELKTLSWYKNPKYGYKIQLPPKWNHSFQELIKGKAGLLTAYPKNGKGVMKIRSELSKGAISLETEEGKKAFTQIIDLFQNKLLRKEFGQLKPVKDGKSHLKVIPVGGQKAILGHYQAGPLEIWVLYFPGKKGIHILWGAYYQKFRKIYKKTILDSLKTFQNYSTSK